MTYAKSPNLRGTAIEKRYYRWLHSYQTCALTGRPDIEIAHVGGLAEGKGMGRKAALWTCLPISKPLHHAEERNRAEFWAKAGFPYKDYLNWAARLFDIFEANDDPTTLFLDMQARANRDYLATILTWRRVGDVLRGV